MSINIVLVGCGKMGGALLSGWLERKVADRYLVVEPDARSLAGVGDSTRIDRFSSADELPADLKPDVVVFAVKPQSMAEVVPPYRRFARAEMVFLSIAAGTRIDFFQERLGRNSPVVRAMPNTPAAIGCGMTVMVASPTATPNQLALCQAMMAAVGDTAWIGDERLMDAVTAVSGSGPAYVFLLIECLAEAGIKAGLPKDLARQSALATVAGATELARAANEDPATLRKNVTSPGGTTAAALEVLMGDDGLARLMERAVLAARDRGRELGG